MRDPVTILFTVLFLLMIFHDIYQNYRRNKYYRVRKNVIIKIKNQDFDYRIRGTFIIFIAVWQGKIQYQLHNDYSNYLGVIVAMIFGIVILIESQKPFEICDNGIFFPDRFIEWDDIVGIEWESMFNGHFEKFIITSKRRPSLLVLQEYDLRMRIPITQKYNINKVLEEKAKSIV